MLKFFYTIAFAIVIIFFSACSDNSTNSGGNIKVDSTVKVTFVELGSETCIPCINMQPVLDSIRSKYGSQILVQFIDAIKNSGDAAPYKITVMPTQVFLDFLGIEFFRHEGFYPEDSIHALLQARGLKKLY